jgi:hypothetical protein
MRRHSIRRIEALWKAGFASMVMKLLVVALLQDRALVHPVMVCLDCLGPFGF